MEEQNIINRILNLINKNGERIDIVNERLEIADRHIQRLYVLAVIQTIAIGAIAIFALN